MKYRPQVHKLFLLALVSVTVPSFAQTIPPIGTIPSGDSIIVVYDVMINTGTTLISNQGTISGSNFPLFNTNDPKTITANDPTLTSVVAAGITYYPIVGASDLSQPSQWTTDPSGGAGSAPADFISAAQLFNVNGNVAKPIVAAPWTISGGSNLILNNTDSLIIRPSASLTIATGSTADFNGKPVTLKSDATGTAFIGNISGALNNATNVTVERYLSSNNNRAYRLLSPSVTTPSTIRVNWQENGNSAANYGTHITGSTTGANGFDATSTGQGSLFIYDPVIPQWQYIANTNASNLNAKNGYLLYVRGDRTIDLNSTASPLPSNNTTLRATGTLLTGPQSFSSVDGLVGNSGFSLVTNPYAAPVNWTSVHAASTGAASSYTLWDPNIGALGGYVTVNTAGIKSNAGSTATTSIQSGQAFFIQATGIAAPVINFMETHKTTANNIDVFRLGTHSEMFSSSLFYTDQFNNRINADGVTSVYANNYDTSVDGNDAIQIANWDEDIAISRNSNLLSIESRPLIDIRDTIAFTMARMKTQGYEWQFNGSGFTHPDLSASLVDKFLNTKTPISLNGTTIIPFTVTANAGSSAADRFMVVFAPNNALPVNMSAVKAYQKGKDIQVEWTTLTDSYIDKYEVEESVNGALFNKAATIAPKGSVSAVTYNWLDMQVNNGSNYYRIKNISKTGEVQYSRVVRVNMGAGAAQIMVYPNPIKDNSFSLSVNLPKENYIITITNKLGQQVYKKQINHPGGAATELLELSTSLARGIYQLTVSDNKKSYVLQLMKE